MSKIYTTPILVAILGFSGCAPNTSTPFVSPNNSSIVATISPESTAYLADDNGEMFVSEEYPEGVEVVLSEDAKLIVSSKDLHINRGYIWEYSLIMLLVFVSVLAVVYFWEKLKRR